MMNLLDGSDVEIRGELTFPETPAKKIETACLATVRLDGAAATILGVKGCDEPFAETFRRDVGRLEFAVASELDGPGIIGVKGVYTRRHGKSRATVEPIGSLHVKTRVRPEYPEDMVVYDYREVDCKMRIEVGTADGLPVAVDAAECPILFVEPSQTALMQWTWYPIPEIDPPQTAFFTVVVKYTLKGGDNSTRPLDPPPSEESVAWSPPPFPSNRGDITAVPRLSGNAVTTTHKQSIDWSYFNSAMPNAGTECPVVVYADPDGKPFWLDLAECPSALQRPTERSLMQWTFSTTPPAVAPYAFRMIISYQAT